MVVATFEIFRDSPPPFLYVFFLQGFSLANKIIYQRNVDREGSKSFVGGLLKRLRLRTYSILLSIVVRADTTHFDSRINSLLTSKLTSWSAILRTGNIKMMHLISFTMPFSLPLPVRTESKKSWMTFIHFLFSFPHALLSFKAEIRFRVFVDHKFWIAF